MPSCPAGMKKPFSIIFYVKSETFGKLGGQYEILSNIKFLLKIYLCLGPSNTEDKYIFNNKHLIILENFIEYNCQNKGLSLI